MGMLPGHAWAVLIILAAALALGAVVAATGMPLGGSGPDSLSSGASASQGRPVIEQGVPDLVLEAGAVVFSTNLEGTIQIDTDVSNIGNATATGYQLAIYDGDPSGSGTLISRVTLSDVAAGGRVVSSTSWSATAGTHQIYVRFEGADPLDPTGNNAINRSFYVLPKVIAIAGPDRTTDPETNVTFNGSSSSSAGSTVSNWTWDFGDSSTGYGAVVKHAFANSGSTYKVYTVTFTVRDGLSRTATDTAKVYVNNATATKPTADAGTAPSGRTIDRLSFNASASQGNITSYVWDFGDGATGSGTYPTHAYYEDGTYTVSLVVIDNASAADAATLSVVVRNRSPIVSPIGDLRTDMGVQLQFVALAYDEDGYIASYSWNFADGSKDTTRTPTHSWNEDGPHAVLLNVTDDDGAIVTMRFYVNITDMPPIARFTAPTTAREGDRVNVDASASTEPGNDIRRYEWDWDSDGTWDNSSAAPTFAHTYWKPGQYNITLRVTDGEGSTNTTRKPITITNVAPTARASVSPVPAVEGQDVTFNASLSTEPGMNITEYSWDWTNDGVWDLNTTNPVVVQAFTKTSANYIIARLRVTDEDNTTGLAYGYYRINNVPPLVDDTNNTGPEDQEITIRVNAEDPGFDFKDYRWDFNDDGVPDNVTTVPYVNHTYWKAGLYQVWVNVTDTNGGWGAGYVKVNVTDVPPIPRVADGTATEGVAKAFKVELLGNEKNITLYSFDLGNDGVYEVNSTTQTTFLNFTKVGYLKCFVRAIDTDGTAGFGSFFVTVNNTPPVVTADTFLVGAEGEPMRVSVRVSEPGMDIKKDGYAWDWNADGVIDTITDRPYADHIFTTPGLKNIRVTVTDIDNTTGSVLLRAFIANVPPTAVIGTPPIAKEGIPITLSAANSTEPGDNIITYQWDLDGDGLYDIETSHADIKYAWDKPGTYQVTLRVTDEDGTYGLDRVFVRVDDVLPIARINVTVKSEDQLSVLDASGSYDAGGLAGYVWTIASPGNTFSTTTRDPVLLYAFDRKVEYTITLAVLDDDTSGGTTAQVGYTVPITSIITIPPTVVWTLPSDATEGQLATFTAIAQDPFPSGTHLTQNFLYEWDFGDGSRTTGPTVAHAYAAGSKPYVVKLVVTDEDEDHATVTANITVKNVAPVVAPVKSIEVKAGNRATSDVTATDLTAGGVTLRLADGSPGWVSLEGAKVVAKPKTDVAGGTYLVTVRAIDALGAETDAYVPIVVTSEEGFSTKPVTMMPFLAMFIVLLLIIIVVAVVLARRRPPAAASTAPPTVPYTSSEEAAPYDVETVVTRRRERAYAAVETGRVSVDLEEEQAATAAAEAQRAADAEAAASAAVRAQAAAAPDAGGFELEPEEAATPPGVKIWRPPPPPEERHIVAEERVAPAQPRAPDEWTAARESPQKGAYKFRKQHDSTTRYRGEGPPK